MTAHPRSRGENQSMRGYPEEGQGSSPLTRGKPTGTWAMTSGTGLIPAHAGKTRAPGPAGVAHAAHPRSRGENDGLAIDIDPAVGSSPLTRGKLSPSP